MGKMVFQRFTGSIPEILAAQGLNQFFPISCVRAFKKSLYLPAGAFPGNPSLTQFIPAPQNLRARRFPLAAQNAWRVRISLRRVKIKIRPRRVPPLHGSQVQDNPVSPAVSLGGKPFPSRKNMEASNPQACFRSPLRTGGQYSYRIKRSVVQDLQLEFCASGGFSVHKSLEGIRLNGGVPRRLVQPPHILILP